MGRERTGAHQGAAKAVGVTMSWHVFGPGRSRARNRERKWQKSMIDCIIRAEREYGGCGKSQRNLAMNPVNRCRAPLPAMWVER